MSDTIVRYWHTLRHLRPVQFYGRLWFRLARPRADLSPGPAGRRAGDGWMTPARRRPSLTGPMQFVLLGQQGTLAGEGWIGPQRSKLWRYNQHYFDDLNAEDAINRSAWHFALIENWIRQNPPGTGVGWDPYPTSLRIVNWIKWAQSGANLPPDFGQSLAIQVRWLLRRLEWHLLGNHLFSNAKALVFAGLFFEGGEASDWLDRGLAVLGREVNEQILPDGAHFELSTMYHVLALEDILDLVNMARTVPAAWDGKRAEAFERLAGCVVPMRRWLNAMCHPDGEIGFFNDAALGVAPSVEQINAYADRLDFSAGTATESVWLRESGYARLQAGSTTVLFDMARIGPDYLPAHSHADTLSLELSVGQRRLIVNGGTSEYGLSPERLRQRSTPAHATVTIDGQNSSDVWSGFRVGRRARIVEASFESRDGLLRAAAAHDGYYGNGGTRYHRRTLQLDGRRLLVRDEITGTGVHHVRIVFPLGEGMKAEPDGAGRISVLDVAHGGKAAMVIESASGAETAVERSTWHPSFGESISTETIVMSFTGNLPWLHDTIMGIRS